MFYVEVGEGIELASRGVLNMNNRNIASFACLQERFQVKNPPHTYIQKLRSFLDPAVTRKVSFLSMQIVSMAFCLLY